MQNRKKSENAKLKKNISKSELCWYQNVPHVLLHVRKCLPTLDVLFTNKTVIGV